MARARSLPNTAVEHCYQMADEIWSGQRLHIKEPVSGFNSETAIRIRLRNILNTLEMLSDDLVEEACDLLMSIDILNDAPNLIVRRCEQMLAAQLPGPIRNPEVMKTASHSAMGGLSRLIICQDIASRNGVWPAKPDSEQDYATARRLRKKGKALPAMEFEDLRKKGAAAYKAKKYKAAVSFFVAADSKKRSIEGLYKLAVSLWRLGDIEGGLWAIRSCLLEDLKNFPSPRWLLKAQMIESRLESLIAGPELEENTDFTVPNPVRIKTTSESTLDDGGLVIPAELDDPEAGDDAPTVMISRPNDV